MSQSKIKNPIPSLFIVYELPEWSSDDLGSKKLSLSTLYNLSFESHAEQSNLEPSELKFKLEIESVGES